MSSANRDVTCLELDDGAFVFAQGKMLNNLEDMSIYADSLLKYKIIRPHMIACQQFGIKDLGDGMRFSKCDCLKACILLSLPKIVVF